MKGEHVPPTGADTRLAKRKGKTEGKTSRTQDASGYSAEVAICRRRAAALAWEQLR